MNKIIIFLALGILVYSGIPLATAVDNEKVSDYTFSQYETISLKRSCVINGTFCAPATTTCNITIQAPNGDNIINNSRLTVNSGFTNITLPNTPRTERYFGFYLNTISCTLGGESGAESFFFEKTADGNPSKTIPTQIIILIISIIILFGGLWFDRYIILKVLPAVAIFILGVITLYPGYSYINYSTLSGLMLGSICLGLGAYFMLDPYFSHGNQKERYTEEITEEVVDATD